MLLGALAGGSVATLATGGGLLRLAVAAALGAILGSRLSGDAGSSALTTAPPSWASAFAMAFRCRDRRRRRSRSARRVAPLCMRCRDAAVRLIRTVLAGAGCQGVSVLRLRPDQGGLPHPVAERRAGQKPVDRIDRAQNRGAEIGFAIEANGRIPPLGRKLLPRARRALERTGSRRPSNPPGAAEAMKSMASLDALRSLRCSSARRRTPLWRAAVRGRFRRC